MTFLGFEDVTTPLGTFEDAAHFMYTDNLRIKAQGEVLESKDVIESWVVAGLGAVRLIQSEDVFENGQLTESTPAQEWLFDHGVIQGVSVGPPPLPTGGSAGSIRNFDPPTGDGAAPLRRTRDGREPAARLRPAALLALGRGSPADSVASAPSPGRSAAW